MSIKFEITKQNNIHFGIAAAAAALVGYFTSASWWVILLFAAVYFGLVNVKLAIWQEIQEVKNGEADKADNVLTNAPHPEYEVVADTWEHSYTRQKAAYPIESVRDNKFWVNVARVDNTLGDRKLLPTCYGCFE